MGTPFLHVKPRGNGLLEIKKHALATQGLPSSDFCTTPYTEGLSPTSHRLTPASRYFFSPSVSIFKAEYSRSKTDRISSTITSGRVCSISEVIFCPTLEAFTKNIRPSGRNSSKPGYCSSSGCSSEAGRNTLVPRLRRRM